MNAGYLVAAVVGCRMNAVYTGVVWRSGFGLGTVSLRRPAAAMRMLLATGCLLVGWSSARLEAFAARPLRCIKCLELGHVQQRCRCDADRSARCYLCGGTDHRARDCGARHSPTLAGWLATGWVPKVAPLPPAAEAGE